MASSEQRWRWSNFPIPQAHVVVATAGLLLDWIWPLGIAFEGLLPTILGIALVAAGVAVMVWATKAAGEVSLAEPGQLVTSGPYSLSRHPMYVAWTLAYFGVALVLSSTWMLILFPVLAVWIHVEAVREERRMVDVFGSAYTSYQARVRRYV